MCGSSVLRLQLFHLFHHWFEECGLRITISDLVLTSKQSYLVNACVLKRLHLSLFVVRRLPFDWKNPFGFVMAITLQYIIFTYAMKVGACVLTLAIGLYLYVIAMSECIKQILFAISQSTRTEAEQNLIQEQLIEYIEFDANVKR